MSTPSSSQREVPAGMVDLGIGQPSPGLLPHEVLARAAAHNASQRERQLLSYGPEQGDAAFREALARFLTPRYGLEVDPGGLFVTNGASQAIDLACTLFARAGDTVFVEEPTYFLALKIFADHRLKAVSLPVDGEGLDVDALEDALGREKPAFLYTIPTFHNPTGVCLSAARRERLAQISRRFGLRVVADEVYHPLCYGEPPPAPLARFCDEGRVVSLGSFSKILAPGLRLGWLQAGPELIERCVTCGLLDSGGGLNPFASGVVRSAIELGLADAHLERLRQAYAGRLRAMVAALRAHLAGRVEFLEPQGGFFVWLALPAHVDSDALAPEARRRGVDFMPGSRFSSRGGLRNFLRLSFAFYDTAELVQGVERLAGAIRS